MHPFYTVSTFIPSFPCSLFPVSSSSFVLVPCVAAVHVILISFSLDYHVLTFLAPQFVFLCSFRIIRVIILMFFFLFLSVQCPFWCGCSLDFFFPLSYAPIVLLYWFAVFHHFLLTRFMFLCFLLPYYGFLQFPCFLIPVPLFFQPQFPLSLKVQMFNWIILSLLSNILDFGVLFLNC